MNPVAGESSAVSRARSEDAKTAWRERIGWYEEEVELETEARRASQLLCEIARIHAEHLHAPAEARSAYLGAARRDPLDPAPGRGQRRLAAQVADWPALRDLLVEALESTESDAGASARTQRVDLLRTLAWVLERHLGAPEEAAAALWAIVELRPEDAEALDALDRVTPTDDPASRLAILELRRNQSSDPARSAVLALEMAELSARTLEEPERAARWYRAAMEGSAAGVSAIEGLMELAIRAREWDRLLPLLVDDVAVQSPAHQGLLRRRALQLIARESAETACPIDILEAIAEAHPTEPELLHDLVDAYERSGAWSAARQILRQLVEIEPELAPCHGYRLGLTLELEGRDDAVVDEAYSECPRTPRGPFVLACIADRRRRWVRGEVPEYLDSTLTLAELTASPAFRAALLAHAGEIQEWLLVDGEGAADCYASATQALAAGSPWALPELPLALRAQLRILTGLRRWAEQVEVLEMFGQQCADPRARTRADDALAELYEVRLEQPARALSTNRAIAERSPGNLRAVRALQRLYAADNDLEGCIEAAEIECQAIEDRPRQLALLTRIAELHDRTGQSVGAEKAWSRALAIDKAFLPALTGLGRILHREGRWHDLAALNQSSLVALPPGDSGRLDVLGRLGEIYERRLEQPDAAAAVYEEILSLTPRAPDAVAGLERIYTAGARWSDLARMMRGRAEDMEAPQARAMALCATAEILHERLGQLDEAARLYEEALSLAPDLQPAVWALERLLIEAQRPDRLVVLYQARQERVRSPGQRAVLGHKLAALLSDEEAQAQWASCLQIEGTSTFDAPACWALARAAATGQRWNECSDALTTLASGVRARNDAHALCRIAAEYAELGGHPARVDRWRKVNAVGPDDLRAWEALLALANAGADRLAEARVLQDAAAVLKCARSRSVALWRAAALCHRGGDPAVAAELLAASVGIGDIDPVPSWLAVHVLREQAGATRRAGLAEALEHAARRLRNGRLASALLADAAAVWRWAQERDDREEHMLACVLEASRLYPVVADLTEEAEQMLRARSDWRGVEALLSARAVHHHAAPDGGEPLSHGDTPEQIADLFHRLAAVQLDALGDADRACETLDALLQRVPDDLAARVMRGDLAYEHRDYESAIAQYGQAVELTSVVDLQVRMHLRMGRAKANHLGDLPGAIRQLRAAVGLLEPSGEACEELGNVALRAGDLETAALAFRQAERVADDPVRVVRAQASHVRTLMAQGETAQAVERLEALSRSTGLAPELRALAREVGPRQEAIPWVHTGRTTVPGEAAYPESIVKALNPPADEPSGARGMISQGPTGRPMPAEHRTISYGRTPPTAVVTAMQRVLDQGARETPGSPSTPAADRPRLTLVGCQGTTTRPDEQRSAGHRDLMSLADPDPSQPSMTERRERPQPSRSSAGHQPLVTAGRNPVGRGSASSSPEPIVEQGGAEPIDPERGPLPDADACLARADHIAHRNAAGASWLRQIACVLGDEPAPGPVRGSLSGRRGPLPLSLRSRLLPRQVPVSLLELLRAVAGRVAWVFSSDAAATGASSAHRLAPNHPVGAIASRVSRVLAVSEVVVLRNISRPYALDVEAGETPYVVIGDALLERTDAAGQSFLVARGLAALSEGTLVAGKLSDREFAAFLGALFDLVDVGAPIRARSRTLHRRMRQRVEPALPVEWRSNIVDLARRAADDVAGLSAGGLRSGLVAHTDRVALSLADGFAGAFDALRQLELSVGGSHKEPDGHFADYLRRSSSARELLMFAASDACLAVRAWSDLREAGDRAVGG